MNDYFAIVLLQLIFTQFDVAQLSVILGLHEDNNKYERIYGICARKTQSTY